MARGWESKSVEEQQDAAAERRREAGLAREASALSAAERDRLQKRESIVLSKVRVQHDLDAATHPRHRAQLRAALKHLEQQLRSLDE